jgi:hypothetical protein
MDDDTDVAMRATLEEEIITAVQNKSRWRKDAPSGGEIEDGECGNY